MGDALPAVPLGGRSLARSMAGGRDFVCALLDGGSLKCWGRAEGGQLGSEAVLTVGDDPDEMGDSLPTVDLGPGESVVQVAAGIQHTCALLLSGAVKCWGRNFFGNLGLEDFRARGHAPETMGGSLPEVDLGTGRTAVSIAAGGERACAILDDGSLKCWGDNSRGQLGLGDKEARGRTVPEMGDSLPAVDLGTGRTVVALASTALPAGAPPAPVSTVAPTPVATVSPSPKPTPVPTTASLAPTPIPLVPAPSTPVPASPTTSPSVPPPAPTTSPSVPGAPTTSPLGPVAPTTSPSSPPAPTEASRSIPAPLTSSPAGATPSPAGATLSPAGATPSPAGATPSPAGATPSPVGATPGPVLGATPSPMGATPSPVGTTTSPAAGIPPTTTPSPSVAGGPEGPGGPEGATEGGGTGAPEVTMEPSVPLSPSSSSSAARDGGSNTSLAPVEGVGVDVTIPETDVGSEQGGSSGDDSNSTTIVASIAAPVGILSLLVIACFLRRSRGGAAPVAAKPDDMLSPHGSMHGSVFGEENAVGQSTQSAVV